MKKILVMCLIALMSLVGIGCTYQPEIPSNSFLLRMKVGIYGQVTQQICIPTFIEKLAGSVEKKEKYLCELKNNVETKLFNNYYIKYWLKYSENQNDEFMIDGENVKFERPSVSEDQTTISFAMYFLNPESWNYYNSTQKQKTEESEYFYFLKKEESQSQFPFNERGLKDYYFEIVNESFEKYFGEEISKEDVSFAYNYINPYSMIRSNADFCFECEEGYSHLWIQNFEGGNKNISVWITKVNRGFWYTIVLAVTLILLVIIFLILKLLKNKENDAISLIKSKV